MKVDMSPAAVTMRLKRVSQLRTLCLSLAKARPANAEPDYESAKGHESILAARDPASTSCDGVDETDSRPKTG
jgi:hypothetical protein